MDKCCYFLLQVIKSYAMPVVILPVQGRMNVIDLENTPWYWSNHQSLPAFTAIIRYNASKQWILPFFSFLLCLILCRDIQGLLCLRGVFYYGSPF